MKTRNRIITSLICLFLVSFISINGTAQDFKADMQKMQEIYNNAEKLQTSMKIDVYATEKATKPVMTKRATIKKEGNNFFYDIDGVTTLVNSKYSIMVNKTNKTIVFKNIEKQLKDRMNEVIPNFDKELEAYNGVEYKGLENGKKHYVVKNVDNQIKFGHIYLDNRGMLSKIVYIYKEQKGKAVIVFSQNSLNPTFKESQFSEKQFFKKKGKEWIPMGTYKYYEVIKVGV
jgi:outer membrane lipoprotein-sorting protein